MYLIWTENLSGAFLIDLSFGLYYACYDSQEQEKMTKGDLRLKDDLGLLTFQGASQWWEVFSFEIVEVDGKDLILQFFNDYGEGRKTIITRLGGDWYEGLRKEMWSMLGIILYLLMKSEFIAIFYSIF